MGCLFQKSPVPHKREKPVVVTMLTGEFPCASALVGRRQLFCHPAQVKDAGYNFVTSSICFANQPNPELRSAQHLRRPAAFRTVHTAEPRENSKQNVTATFMSLRSPECAEQFLELKLLHFITISPDRILQDSASRKMKISVIRKNLFFITVLDVQRAEKRNGLCGRATKFDVSS